MVRILFCLLCCAALAMQGLSTKAENTNSSSSSATESPIPRPTSFQDVSTAPSYTTVATTSTTNSNKSNLTLPMVINTWNYPEANDYAWRILRQTEGGLGQTRNAVVEGCGKCEQTQCRRSVGYGGTPNELGEITLDAMVMDGATMDVGAVAGLVDVKEAIRVARHVLERTKHTMLVGPGASKFAVAMGFHTDSLVTPQTHAEWLQWKAENCQPNFWRRVYPDPEISCGPYSLKATPLTRMKEEPARTEFKLGPQNHDTIGMVAIDANSQIHTGTSTNGLDYKIHGRVGDSPVAGAGSYADNEVGAAVATGDGDISMRFLPTFLAVEAMRAGKTPGEAAAASVKRIVKHYKDYFGAIIAVNRLGQYAAACYGMSEFPFIVSNPAEGTVVKRVKCMPGNRRS